MMWRKPWTPFGVVMHEEPIQGYPHPPSKIHHGIGYLSDGTAVPEYECWSAAADAHLSPLEFRELSWQDRAKLVAFSRLRGLIEAHVQYAAMGK